MRKLVTSALPYANGPLHLGHLAGAYLPADVYVRYLRSKGEDVVWVCGSDEHGAAISMRAKTEGRTESDIVDTYHALNSDAFVRFGVSFDIFHRTSAPLHHETSQALFTQLIEQGHQFEERTTEQYYDTEFETFLADRFIQGTCPNCGFAEAYGDQCENCGRDLSPTELIDPKSKLSGAKPVRKATTHWYFRLDLHEAWLRQYIADGLVDGQPHHDAKLWRNHVTGQCLSWLDAGLQPRAYTRDLDWGIQVPTVPGHISEEEAKGKVLYVWFDAPIGYISATKQWAIDRGEPDLWERYWKHGEAELVHFIGKDNIVFHCLTFQATLKALGDYNVASYVPANQFLNFEGDKFSKSRGWGITMDEYLADFAALPNHVDAMRYALLRNAPENRDADFRWDDFVGFHDKELADKLGNFVNRTLVLVHKYFDGRVPEGALPPDAHAELRARFAEVDQLLATFNFKDALATAIGLIDWANADLQARAPWTLAKANLDDPAIAEAMIVACQSVALASVLFAPFVPDTGERLSALLELPPITFAQAEATLASAKTFFPAGHRLGEPTILFAKIQDRKDDSRLALVQAQKDKLQAILNRDATAPKSGPSPGDKTSTAKEASSANETAEAAAAPSTIQYEDFAKLDLRTGRITAAEAIPKADKLLELSVDLGTEQRTVVSGIALHFSPEALVGQEVVLLTNLAPRKLRGVESQGMILMADTPEGGLAFVAPPEGSAPGMRVS